MPIDLFHVPPAWPGYTHSPSNHKERNAKKLTSGLKLSDFLVPVMFLNSYLFAFHIIQLDTVCQTDRLALYPKGSPRDLALCRGPRAEGAGGISAEAPLIVQQGPASSHRK